MPDTPQNLLAHVASGIQKMCPETAKSKTAEPCECPMPGNGMMPQFEAAETAKEAESVRSNILRSWVHRFAVRQHIFKTIANLLRHS